MLAYVPLLARPIDGGSPRTGLTENEHGGREQRVILVGNLARIRRRARFNNGGEVVNMRIATSESWKDKDGNRRERTEWHNRRDLQREPRPRREELSCARAQAFTSKARSRPASGRTRRATTATRPKSRCSASAASWSCSMRAAKAAVRAEALAATNMAQSRVAASAAAAPSPSRVPSRRRSTATLMTTSRSKGCSCRLAVL